MAAVTQKLNRFLRQKKGDSTVEFIVTAAVLVLIFATLVTAMIYVTQYYNASYICRRTVRTIEVEGEYNEQSISSLADELGGHSLSGLSITVDAPFRRGNRIQLRDEFTVHLRAYYPINILMLSSDTVQVRLPIRITLSGRSEVYWK